MLTRLGHYADRVLEYGWLFAALFVPLFFNVYSSRVFEPDKISTLRSIVLIMALAWVVKLLEGGVRGYRRSTATTATGKLAAAANGAAERGLPPWLGFLRVLMVVPILVYALAYLVSTIFTVTFDATLYGSYQRLQGTYSQYSYMLLGVMVLANMRTRVQLERLITFMLLTSLPVALYGLMQAAPLISPDLKLDLLPWAGDTSTRVASTMGNAIFVAAWLIMVVPFALYRLFHGLSVAAAARRARGEEPERAAPAHGARGGASRKIAADEPGYGWAVPAAGLGLIMMSMFIFYFAMKVMGGIPFPETGTFWDMPNAQIKDFPKALVAWIYPAAIVVFFAVGLALEWLSKQTNNPSTVSRYLPASGAGLFFASFISVCFDWSPLRLNDAAGNPTNELVASVQFQPSGLLWVLFFLLLWGAVSTAIYALSNNETRGASGTESRVQRSAVNVGYGVLLGLQIVCIYLTQSRGPWLGLGAGLFAFATAMWFVGRRNRVRWVARAGRAVTLTALALALFVGVLNIPNSPLGALSNMPVVGRGIERLSTLARTEDGTGKVRTLIWKGATDLILSNPVRTLIGWGPEAMYVAYNPHYPAELAQYELRNATPDRSHNVEFDQMVTMGVAGLLAYYFLVGAFFFYIMSILKRVTTTRDQLLVIAMIAVMVAHFIEIQTGIQIAASWTYFYLLIGMMVAFGYYINTHLRPEPALAHADEAPPASVPAVAAAAPQKHQTATQARRERAAGSSSATGRGSSAAQRRGPSQPVARQAVAPTGERAFRSPARLALYAVLAIVVYTINFGLSLSWLGIPLSIPGVNSATVRADSLYKVGLQYDQIKAWPESILYYQRAIQLQPTQDYYYLFLGRSWLEFAKQADQERDTTDLGKRFGGNINVRNLYQLPTRVPCRAFREYTSEADRAEERDCRLKQGEALLQEAHTLNPLNTDHFANLGRLYLYWGDPTGGKDPAKVKLAVQNFELATGRTPGNAQLWDELAVAYSRDGQFSKAIETLNYSQNEVDPTYARTPFLRGQLYQERLLNIHDALASGRALPEGGESDYGKLVLETARAYSDTVRLDPAQLLDDNFRTRADFLLLTSQPFTATNTTLDQGTVSNAVTSTITMALETTAMRGEQQLAGYLRERGAFTGTENRVPDNVLQQMWQDPQWAANTVEGRQWSDPSMPGLVRNSVLSYVGLGYIYQKTGRVDRTKEVLNRALLLDPNNAQAAQDLQALNASP